MASIRLHLPILLLLLSVVFMAFYRLLSTPLFHPLDFAILQEAYILSQDPTQMFRHLGTYFSQPVLQLTFLLEFTLFCANQAGYIAVNLVIHTLNAFMVYMLVNMLLARKNVAVLAALLFALQVGSYGKILMTVEYLEALLMAHLHLLVLYFLIRNDFRHQSRLSSPYFLLALAIFLLAGLTMTSTFSLLGCLLAYKFFFYKERGRRGVLSLNLMILIVVGILFYLAQNRWGYQDPVIYEDTTGPLSFTLTSFKNIFRYLNLMVFPLQPSGMLEHANPFVRIVYDSRTVIRVLLTIAIISYSFFGFVFGNRAVRFFIAWTYIILLPFTGITVSGIWLNLKHLYLTSLGFCVILSAGAWGTSALLRVRKWRRLVPFLVPLAFVLLALSVTYQIDDQNRRRGQDPPIVDLRQQTEQLCEE
jgi:hypothetical protein